MPFTLIHGPDIPGAILFFTASGFHFTSRYIHNWASFPLWLIPLHSFRNFSLLFSSSILDTYQPRGIIFQCHIFLRFHTVHGVCVARILKWFAVHFSMGQVLSELSTMTCPSWMTLHGMAHNFIELDKSVIHVIILVCFLWLQFLFWRLWVYSSCFFCLPFVDEDKRLGQASWWEGMAMGKTGSCSGGQGHAQ